MGKRRRTKRLRVTTLASFFGAGTVTTNLIGDLSPRGLLVMTDANVQPGDSVERKVEVPGGREALLA